MEDPEPETQEVAGMVTAIRIIQLASNPLVVLSNMSRHLGPCFGRVWKRQPSSIPWHLSLSLLCFANFTDQIQWLFKDFLEPPLQDDAPRFVSDALTSAAESNTKTQSVFLNLLLRPMRFCEPDRRLFIPFSSVPFTTESCFDTSLDTSLPAHMYSYTGPPEGYRGRRLEV